MKKHSMAGKLKIWELAALLALSTALLTAAWCTGRQEKLAGGLIRLHVLAESDSAAHQEAKLRARDAVLTLLTPALEGVEDVAEAEARLEALIPLLERTAAAAAGARQARVTLSRESYPTRCYEGFSLPAGQYRSLRVVLGEGAGRNWWCVVYPPLCMQAAEDCLETGAFDQEDWRLISGDGEEYVIRFRLLELWGELTQRLEG